MPRDLLLRLIKLVGVFVIVIFGLRAAAIDPTSNLRTTTATSRECAEAFRTFHAAHLADPALDRRPHQVRTLSACRGKLTWLRIARDYQGDRADDLFPPGERYLAATALGRVHTLICVGHEALPACANPYR